MVFDPAIPELATFALPATWRNRAGRVDRSACLPIDGRAVWQDAPWCMHEHEEWLHAPGAPAKKYWGRRGQVRLTAGLVGQWENQRVPRAIAGDYRTAKSAAMCPIAGQPDAAWRQTQLKKLRRGSWDVARLDATARLLARGWLSATEVERTTSGGGASGGGQVKGRSDGLLVNPNAGAARQKSPGLAPGWEHWLDVVAVVHGGMDGWMMDERMDGRKAPARSASKGTQGATGRGFDRPVPPNRTSVMREHDGSGARVMREHDGSGARVAGEGDDNRASVMREHDGSGAHVTDGINTISGLTPAARPTPDGLTPGNGRGKLVQRRLVCPTCGAWARKLFLLLAAPQEWRDAQVAALWLRTMDQRRGNRPRCEAELRIIARYAPLWGPRVPRCAACWGLRYGESRRKVPGTHPA